MRTFPGLHEPLGSHSIIRATELPELGVTHGHCPLVCRSCIPVNVLIQPNTTSLGTGDQGSYYVTLAAEQAVLSVMSFNVTGNVLDLGIMGNFNTSGPIEITITMPAGSLEAITTSSSGAQSQLLRKRSSHSQGPIWTPFLP